MMPKDEESKQPYQAPYHRFIDVKIAKLRKFCADNEVDLKGLLEKHDKDG